MFHPLNPFDPTSPATPQAAPPSPTPRSKTPDLRLPGNLPHLPERPASSQHRPSLYLPGLPSPSLTLPPTPAPAVLRAQKKGSPSRLKLPKLRKTHTARAPVAGGPARLRKRDRVKLLWTKIKKKLGLGAKRPPTKGVKPAAQVPPVPKAPVPVSPRL